MGFGRAQGACRRRARGFRTRASTGTLSSASSASSGSSRCTIPCARRPTEAVAEARSAGLRVEMITGDHPLTARAIGRALGLPESAIHARVTPAEKLRLVESLAGRA